MMRSCLRRSPRYAGMTRVLCYCFLFVCLFLIFFSFVFLIFVTIFTEINFSFPPPQKTIKVIIIIIMSVIFVQSRVLPHLFREGTCLPLDLFKVYLSKVQIFC